MLSGCGPLLLQQGARTVDPGKIVVGAANGFYHDTGAGSSNGNKENAADVPSASVRMGLAQSVDAGLTFSPYFTRADGKVMLLRGDGVELAVDAGLGAGYIDTHTDASGDAPASTSVNRYTAADGALILGHHLPGGSEIFLAGRIGYENTSSSDSNTWSRLWGGTVGVKLPLKQNLSLIPEIDVVHTEGHPSPVGQDTAVIPALGIAAGF